MQSAIFFATPADFRNWLEKNHDKTSEQWVGFYKKDYRKPSITWPESVDAALSYGWIDGLRKSIDDISYKIRFTPRKSTSNWSAINIKRVEELTKLGLMRPAGLKAFQKRKEEKSAIYSYEQKKSIQLSAEYEKRFRADKKAWEFFQKQAPWYRRTCVYWIMTAKQEETRARRLATLMEDSRKGQIIGPVKKAKN
ncbi:YdeI/OmpD-associated family protein [bacterium]|nr:YdeI/OmpD-associated family protein [bacterium]